MQIHNKVQIQTERELDMKNNYTKVFRQSLAAATIAAILGTAGIANAANTDGTIKGVVSTLEGSLSGAEITIRNKATGFSKTITADENGSYRFPHLSTGMYSITAEKVGYETISLDSVIVTLGDSTDVGLKMQSGDTEVISVIGSTIAQIDVSSSESALNITAVELSRFPVPRNVNAVALLAPGTTEGDSRFDGAISFGGASAAENSTYINGLNVTNFRNGLGFSTVPYSFYKEFQIKTGGYSAEFGRATGGVINAVTKSGSNEFHFGGEIYSTPDSLRGEGQDTRFPDGRYYRTNSKDERNELNASIYASGAIIQDTLFFYAMYEARNRDSNYSNTSGTQWTEYNNSTDFWGAKIDWQINDDHKLEFLAFSDSNDGTYDNYGYDIQTEKKGDFTSTDIEERGGDNYSITYTGYITDDFSVKMLYGVNEYSLTDKSSVQDDCADVNDTRAVAVSGDLGCTSSAGIEDGNDDREAFRIDFEYALDDHLIRFGYDREVNTSGSVQKYSGPDGIAYTISDYTDSRQLPNQFIAPTSAGDSYVAARKRTVGGDFETESSAFYIEDIWNATDNITLTLGARLEVFDNKNSAGSTFVKVDNMFAPRLGLAWDINGDGESKFFANAGRYFLPVASNTNVRLSGNESDNETYYVFNGLSNESLDGVSYQLPILGEQLGEVRVTGDGTVPNTRSIVDQDLDPMYQDEYILGYEQVINDNWAWGIKGLTRSLNGAIDDMYFGTLPNGCELNDYVLANPGEEVTIFADTNCDGSADSLYTFDSADSGYPKAERKYHSVELTLNRAWDDVWTMNTSYTWSHSYGNSEGLVKSDNGQGDAGLTTDFDFPELMDGAYGNLPNDRRHQLRLRGAYAVTENLIISANLRIESGRPKNIFGVDHPNGRPAYGSTYYIVNSDGEFSKNSRGSAGETPWISTLDLSAAYTMQVSDADVKFKVDVFNALDSHTVRYNQENERFSTFRFPRVYQTPRSVQLSASVDF
jgi:hypothetical protein